MTFVPLKEAAIFQPIGDVNVWKEPSNCSERKVLYGRSVADMAVNHFPVDNVDILFVNNHVTC